MIASSTLRTSASDIEWNGRQNRPSSITRISLRPVSRSAARFFPASSISAPWTTSTAPSIRQPVPVPQPTADSLCLLPCPSFDQRCSSIFPRFFFPTDGQFRGTLVRLFEARLEAARRSIDSHRGYFEPCFFSWIILIRRFVCTFSVRLWIEFVNVLWAISGFFCLVGSSFVWQNVFLLALKLLHDWVGLELVCKNVIKIPLCVFYYEFVGYFCCCYLLWMRI